MAEKQIGKPVAVAVGAALAGSFAAAQADSDTGVSPFAITALGAGYLLGAQEAEGSCGEGKCGSDKEAGAEGSCGGDKEAEAPVAVTRKPKVPVAVTSRKQKLLVAATKPKPRPAVAATSQKRKLPAAVTRPRQKPAAVATRLKPKLPAVVTRPTLKHLAAATRKKPRASAAKASVVPSNQHFA